MGWRVNWYECPKDINPIKLIQSDDGEIVDFEILGKEILGNEGTSIWKIIRNREDFNKEINCLLPSEDFDIYSISKEGLRLIILEYKKVITEHFEEIYQTKDQFEMEHYFRKKVFEWSGGWAIIENLEKDYFTVTRSSQFEYTIFNLANLYKLFDWDNKQLVIYGG